MISCINNWTAAVDAGKTTSFIKPCLEYMLGFKVFVM